MLWSKIDAKERNWGCWECGVILNSVVRKVLNKKVTSKSQWITEGKNQGKQ